MSDEDNVTETGKEKHRWYHYFHFDLVKVISLRDGFFGRRLSPDVDIYKYECKWCKYKKEVRIIE